MAEAFDYSRAKSTATRMLERYGQQMTLRHVTAGDYANGEATLANVEEVVLGVVGTYTTYEQQNALIESDDRKITIAAEGVETTPVPGDEILIGTDVGKIIRVDPLEPAGVTILYALQVRF